MKLKRVRVRMYRNILDSGEVPIEPDVTCFVGKNESGKTAFLQALWLLNPARGKRMFSVPEHYPAWLEKRHRLEGKKLEELHPVEAYFAWELADREVIDSHFGTGVSPEDQELMLWKSYGNKLGWEHACNEEKAVSNFLNGQNLTEDIASKLRGCESFAALAPVLTEQLGGAEEEVAKTVIKAIETRRIELVGKEGFSAMLWKLIQPRIPPLLYFAEYSKLPYTVKIDKVLSDGTLTEGETTARALLRLGGAENEYLRNPDYERRTRELENVANSLTEDVLEYWTTNNQLRVLPEITQRTEQRPDGAHAVLDELKIRIWDNRHSLSLPFDQHSAGFQWFFSFLAAFSEFEYAEPAIIILLDEPAVGLHGKAQADFLRFIKERLTKRCQVVYTTHSPFMVQPGHLERVRLVEDRGKEVGAVVSTDVLSHDRDTLFPLQGALGYDLVQHLFVSENNLVVEGTSDYTYLFLVSEYLAAQEGRVSLDKKWSIVPVGGADAIPTFVALLGNHLSITVVVDSRKEGHQRLNRLAADGYLAKQRIILVGETVGRKLADIEDLFAVSEYLDLYNRAFKSSLAESDLKGNDPIVSRIARKIGVDRFDHGKPADVLLRERDKFLPKLSEETLKRFEALFARINSTL